MRTKGSDLALPWSGLRLIKPDGSFLENTTVRINFADGSYELSDYPLGSYYIRASASDYFAQVADGVDCTPTQFDFECDLQAARLYELSGSDVVVNFELVPRGQKIIVETTDGKPLPGIAIDVWNQAGYPIGAISSGPDGSAIVRPYYQAIFLSTDSMGGYTDEVYRDIQCPRGTSAYLGNCPLVGATAVTSPNPDPATPPIVFSLAVDAGIFSDDFEGSAPVN